MKISELKQYLCLRLQEALPALQDVIFKDDAGDVWSWAVTGSSYDTCSNKNAKEALKNIGAAIVVCSPSERKTLNAVTNSALREARFPVLVLGNPLKPDAPNHDDLITQIEQAAVRIKDSCHLQQWILGEMAKFETPNSSVLFLHCSYRI